MKRANMRLITYNYMQAEETYNKVTEWVNGIKEDSDIRVTVDWNFSSALAGYYDVRTLVQEIVNDRIFDIIIDAKEIATARYEEARSELKMEASKL